jgi:hypothetical protein
VGLGGLAGSSSCWGMALLFLTGATDGAADSSRRSLPAAVDNLERPLGEFFLFFQLPASVPDIRSEILGAPATH